MNHEKPQAGSPQIYEYGETHNSLGMSDLSPDNSETLYGTTPSVNINEAGNVEDRRERRGEGLWFVLQGASCVIQILTPHRRVLNERHINVSGSKGGWCVLAFCVTNG